MILVTGCSGVLGVALLEALQERHKNVVGVRSADLDLADFDSTLQFFKSVRPRVVYHAAARVHGLMGNREFPCDVFTENARINTNAVEAARRAGCGKFIGVSTVAAYPDGLPFPIAEGSFWSGAPHKSEQAYAHAKRAMLAHLEACQAQYGMSFTYPIVTNLFGQHDRFDETHGHVIPSLISKFHRAAQEGGAVTVWGTGKAKRDFLYSKDAARAIVLAGEKAEGPINIVSGSTVPIRSVVEALARISGVDNVAWDASKPDGQLDRSFDIATLKSLGFTPSYSLDQGLEETYRWYAANFPNVRN